MTESVIVSDNKVSDLGLIQQILTEAGYEVETIQDNSEADLLDVAVDAVAMIPDARTTITRRLIESVETLEVIGRGGIGVDNIDLEAAEEHGVTVVNVPDYSLDEVSAHALTLALTCLRKIRVFDRSVRDGEWDWTVGEPIPRLADLTVGLVAFGKISRRHARKLQGFGVDVVAYDPYVEDYRMHDLGVEKVEFDELLARADIISIHAPLTDDTNGMFGRDEFAAMKESAVLVNTARGPIIDQDALVDALEHGEIASAGLDVMEVEPPTDPALLERDDVVLTPHVGWHSTESLRDLSQSVAEDVVRVLQGEEPKSPVTTGNPWL